MPITGPFDENGAGPSALEKSIEWGGNSGGLTTSDVITAAGAAVGAIIGQVLADIGGLKGFANFRFGIYGALLGAGMAYAGQTIYPMGRAGVADLWKDKDVWSVMTINGVTQYVLRESAFVQVGGKGTKSAPGFINMQDGSPNRNFPLGYNGAALIGAIDRATAGKKRKEMARRIAEKMVPLMWPSYDYPTSMDYAGILAPKYEDKIREMRSFYDSKRSSLKNPLI